MFEDGFSISEEEVLAVLSKLVINKAPGPDDISSWVLKEGKEALAKPLAKLFNMTLDQGKLPNEWKSAIVTPIHKSGKKSKAANYRPVSLTSQVCKAMENVIKAKLMRKVGRGR